MKEKSEGKIAYIFIILIIVAIMIIPIIFIKLDYTKKLGKDIYNNFEFWKAYMTYFGTITLGTVSLIQNNRLHNQNKELEKMNKELLCLEESDYTPKLFVMNNNDQSIHSEENNPNLIINKIMSDYTKRYDNSPYYSYYIKLSNETKKHLQLLLEYSGKGICNKVTVKDIYIKEKEKDEIKYQLSNVEINISLKNEKNIILNILFDSNDKCIEYMKLDMELSLQKNKYNEIIKIEFETNVAYPEDENTYLKSVEYF